MVRVWNNEGSVDVINDISSDEEFLARLEKDDIDLYCDVIDGEGLYSDGMDEVDHTEMDYATWLSQQ